MKIEIPEGSVLKRLVKPHKKTSRLVTEKDIDRVIEEVKILHTICFEPSGLYKAAYAMHHSQINNEDPLQLFVTADRLIVINPVITNHTKTTVDSIEGCVTFSHLPQIKVQRYHKIEVEYQTIMTDPEDSTKFKLSSKIQEKLSGKNAFIWQHEINHGFASYIYDKK